MTEPQQQERDDGAVSGAAQVAAMGGDASPEDALEEDAVGEDATDEGPPSDRADAAG